MSLIEYYNEKFSIDLKKLEFEKPNSAILSDPELFKIDSTTVYFGGPNWENMINDTKHIDEENLEYFCILLFTITFIDLGMFSNFNEYYDVFRKNTNYPKFGWSGFGTHYENPKKLLLIPEEKGLVDYSYLKDNFKEYFDLLRLICDDFFINNDENCNTTIFLHTILNDKYFKLNDNDKNSIFSLIYMEFDKEILSQILKKWDDDFSAVETMIISCNDLKNFNKNCKIVSLHDTGYRDEMEEEDIVDAVLVNYFSIEILKILESYVKAENEEISYILEFNGEITRESNGIEFRLTIETADGEDDLQEFIYL
jgi:hypothetical protein